MEQIEKLKDKLYNLILKEDSLYRGEILKVSQELDKQIVGYYLGKKKCS
ncbi:MAG: aspartyl-phosphate phosphatase Spo0E family protein [Solirubrobacterales bacterium]